jgi:aminopeptidase C
MNKNLSFGYSHLGFHTLIKLNVKITSAAAELLKQTYNVWTNDNGKFGYRIEGCLTSDKVWDFKQSLQLAILDYKIEQLTFKKLTLLGVVSVVDKFDNCLDNLPY